MSHIPHKKSMTKNRKPKIPRDRRILMRKRKKINDRMKLSLSEATRKKLQHKLVNIEISLQQSHKASYQARENKAVDAIKSNPKYFFAYAKKTFNGC